MAKDIGHVLSMVFMPATSWNLFARLLDKRIIHNKKKDILGFDLQGKKKLLQRCLCNLTHVPDVFRQESSKAGQRSVKKCKGKGLNHRRGMDLFAQLDKTDDEG